MGSTSTSSMELGGAVYVHRRRRMDARARSRVDDADHDAFSGDARVPGPAAVGQAQEVREVSVCSWRSSSGTTEITFFWAANFSASSGVSTAANPFRANS